MPQIAINLLREMLQAKRPARGGKFHVPRGLPLAIGGAILTIVLLAVAALLFVGTSQQRAFARLRQEWDALNPKRVALVELQAEQGRLDARLAVLKRLVEGRTVWSRPLNRLSDLVPDGVWLSKLTIEPPDRLTLEGSALERAGEGMQAVSKLLSGLQADESFTSAFDAITLQSFTTRKAGATEVLDFTVVCTRGGAAGGPAKTGTSGHTP